TWASLTYSGVSFTADPHFYQQQATVLDGVFDPTTGGFPSNVVAIDNGYAQIGPREATVLATLSNVGTAVSLSDVAGLTAGISHHGIGTMSSSVEWNSILHPPTTGTLTVNVGYTLTQVGVPSLTGGFHATGDMQMVLDGHALHATFGATDGTLSRTGTLSLTE